MYPESAYKEITISPIPVDKKAGKFKEWLDCASLIDMKPNTPVMEVFSFLAYETVGQVGTHDGSCEEQLLLTSRRPTVD